MKKLFIIAAIALTFTFVIGTVFVKAFNNEKLNILIYGVDGRENIDEVERSDAIILVNYNFNSSELTVTSIPRDSYVKISCKNNEYDKINHAYAYGKEKCLNDTVSNLFGINNPNNIMVSFNNVVKLIDYFGLIEVTPNYTFCQSDEKYSNKYCFEKNKKILIDGKQALAYMRNRKSLPNGDFDRVKNQRQILKILINKFLNLGIIDKIKFYNYAKENAQTDLNLTDFNIKRIINVKQIKLNEYTLKGESYINKYYYYKLDSNYLEKIKKYYI